MLASRGQMACGSLVKRWHPHLHLHQYEPLKPSLRRTPPPCTSGHSPLPANVRRPTSLGGGDRSCEEELFILFTYLFLSSGQVTRCVAAGLLTRVYGYRLHRDVSTASVPPRRRLCAVRFCTRHASCSPRRLETASPTCAPLATLFAPVASCSATPPHLQTNISSIEGPKLPCP